MEKPCSKTSLKKASPKKVKVAKKKSPKKVVKKSSPNKSVKKKSSPKKSEKKKSPKKTEKKMSPNKSEKKKRPAPAHSKLQTEVIKMICEMYDLKYSEGMRKLKEVMEKALGMPYQKAKENGMTYMEALEKTKKYLLEK
jgi:hypothetical protein